MTVSRVINGTGNVRPATQEMVDEAIAALRYAPNPAARSLAGAGQCRIGIIYGNPSAGFLSEFLVGGLDQASRTDTQLLLEKCELGEHEIEVARHLVSSGIDGVILPPPFCEREEILEILEEAGVPTVALATGKRQNCCMAVSIDDRKAAFEMTAHLIGLGHRRIGFVKGDPNISASTQRLLGYGDALADAGIAEEEGLIANGDFTYRSGLCAAEQLLGLFDRPTAIFASNDDMAAAAVAVAHRLGLDIPRQLTVCGFDDTVLSTAIWPELTTIRQPIADMTRAAVDMLVATVRQTSGAPSAAERHRLLDFALIRRGSDAAPAE
jgi:LacI family transcriptional regulator